MELWVLTGLGCFTASNSNTLELYIRTEFMFHVKKKMIKMTR
jgi:hypothetical protein